MSREAKLKKISRRRERDFREKKVTKACLTPKASSEDPSPRVLLGLSYDITWEPIDEDNPELAKLKDEVGEERWEELGSQMFETPEKNIPILEALLERHPNVPTLYNWLGVAYQAADEDAKVAAITRLNFERNPDYLFAKTGHCEILLHEGHIGEVSRILDKKFDLKLMYPHRDVFHITELIGFQHLLVSYFFKLGNSDQARIHLDIMEKMAPNNPMTRQARFLLELDSFKFSSFLRDWGKGKRTQTATPR